MHFEIPIAPPPAETSIPQFVQEENIGFFLAYIFSFPN
jgi:hypothetical protein